MWRHIKQLINDQAQASVPSTQLAALSYFCPRAGWSDETRNPCIRSLASKHADAQQGDLKEAEPYTVDDMLLIENAFLDVSCPLQKASSHGSASWESAPAPALPTASARTQPRCRCLARATQRRTLGARKPYGAVIGQLQVWALRTRGEQTSGLRVGPTSSLSTLN